MPKVSVYIPDELWDRVRSVEPEAAGSQFIQETIREYVERRERKPYAELSDTLLAERERTKEKVRSGLASRYRQGYNAGLVLAEQLSWEAFQAFADLNWDFLAFDAYVNEGVVFDLDGEELDRFSDVWDDALDQVGEPMRGWPAGPFGGGVVDALDHVWEDIRDIGTPGPRRPRPSSPAGEQRVTPAAPDAKAVAPVVVPFREETDGAGPV